MVSNCAKVNGTILLPTLQGLANYWYLKTRHDNLFEPVRYLLREPLSIKHHVLAPAPLQRMASSLASRGQCVRMHSKFRGGAGHTHESITDTCFGLRMSCRFTEGN